MSKQNQKEFEGLEQVDKALVEGEHFIEANLNKILLGLALVIGVVVGVYAYIKFYQEPKEEKAVAELFVAENNFILGQDSLAVAGEGMSSMGLRQVAEEYAGTEAGAMAHVYTGIAFYEEGKYEEAIEELKQCTAEDNYVAPSVKRLIGDCYVQLNKLEEAVAEYEEAASMADNPAIAPSCLLKAGRVYEVLGQKDKAIALYEEIQEKYYTSPEKELVATDLMRAKAGK